ncbi:MAG: hypothetical protein PQJ61_01735 [Spirochaetales bacterium]|uniref:Uncharacterized protein n=1 Tax=Candidatus Thalassospirochaeta sargassi TaxID=3119039 RepID=A0AAJ1MJ42_9SPIO|nr:hypothetical protein [Spirochaetales bacterium]
MKIENTDKFIKNVEDLVDPAEVCNLFFFQGFKKLLPRSVFKRMLIKTSKKTPHMGFIIEPYSLFLFFKINDVEKAQSLLPDRYKLVKASVFEGDEPEYYFGIGNLYTRGSTFWGIRLESYLTAIDTETGLLSWIFFDILSNTIIAVPSEGVADPNSRDAIFTTGPRGDIYVDIKDDKSDRQLTLKGNITKGNMRRPDQPLWITGNTSIGYIKEISDYGDDPFAVVFDPAEVSEAYDCPVDDFNITVNTLVPDFAEQKLAKVACFPYTQHYIADSPGCRTYVRNDEDLIRNYNKFAKMNEMKTFSTKSIKKLFFAGILISPIISIILFILLLLNI